MQMGNGLAAVRAVVDDQAVAGFVQAQLGRDRRRFEQQWPSSWSSSGAASERRGMFFFGTIKTWTGALG